MTIYEIKKENSNDLIKLANELKKKLFALTFKAKLGKIEKPHEINATKKEIARIFTVLNERNENINFKFHKISKDLITEKKPTTVKIKSSNIKSNTKVKTTKKTSDKINSSKTLNLKTKSETKINSIDKLKSNKDKG